MATARQLMFLTFAISFCVVVVFSQQAPTRTPASQRGSLAEVAEESQLSAALVELYKAGKFDEALPVGKRLLELREKILGPDDLLVAEALSNLAEVYRAKTKYNEAQPLYRRSLAILERNPGANTALLINTQERLADFAFAKRDYKASSGFLERALAVKESVTGKEDPSLIPLLHHLANTFQAQRQFDKAEPLYLRSLTIAEQRLGKRDPETVSMMKDYACLDLRAKVPGPMGPEQAKELDEAGRLKQRAGCWLYGFKDDCESYPPTENQKVDKSNGRAFSLPIPAYPMRARQERAAGTVFVAVLIDEGGNVIDAKTVCGGPPLLLDSAKTAARGAKFTPTTIAGKPKQVYGVITYTFMRP